MKAAIFPIFSNKGLSDLSPTKSLLNVRTCVCYTVYAARRTAFVYRTRLKTKWQKIGTVLPMIRKSKSVTISMPKALRIFLDFQMLVEYLLGGNTAA